MGGAGKARTPHLLNFPPCPQISNNINRCWLDVISL